MLTDERLVAFLATSNAEGARAFYEGVLGLTFAGDNGHLVMFDCGPARIALQKTATVTPKPGTAVGWAVADLHGTVRSLAAKGVVFERFAGMEQDEAGVWRPGLGEGVAWFKDPDGNVLSLSGTV